MNIFVKSTRSKNSCLFVGSCVCVGYAFFFKAEKKKKEGGKKDVSCGSKKKNSKGTERIAKLPPVAVSVLCDIRSSLLLYFHCYSFFISGAVLVCCNLIGGK